MNFRRILSKSSLRSSSSSRKSLSPAEEVSRLQNEIELLKQTIESLKVSVESRDAAIGTLAREKEKLYVELKSAQRTNRNLHQQLVDERDMNAKEKEYLIGEINRLSKNKSRENQDRQEDEQSNTSLKEDIKAKDEIIYNICSKYLKIKNSKQALQKKMERLQHQSQKVCENVILLLHENRQTLDHLLRKLVKASTISPNSKNYLRLLKMNASLHYENTQLKLCLSVKDIPNEANEGYQTTEKKQDKYAAKYSKSEGKLESTSATSRKRSPLRYQPVLSKLYTMQKLEDVIKNFSQVHDIFSPYFRRKKHFYNSDPCLSRF